MRMLNTHWIMQMVKHKQFQSVVTQNHTKNCMMKRVVEWQNHNICKFVKKNAGSVHGTIGKALQWIEGDMAANSRRQKCRKFAYIICVISITCNLGYRRKTFRIIISHVCYHARRKVLKVLNLRLSEHSSSCAI